MICPYLLISTYSRTIKTQERRDFFTHTLAHTLLPDTTYILIPYPFLESIRILTVFRGRAFFSETHFL